MCLAKDETCPKTSPWSKLLRQRSKPRLSRKVISSTKVNLNKCWSKFNGLVSNCAPRADLPSYNAVYPDPLNTVPYSNFFQPNLASDENKENVENQNKYNRQRFEIMSCEQEINQNMANEILEVCNSNHRYVCTIEFNRILKNI